MSVQSLPAYFFTPQHIILVGASERPHSLGERILTALLNAPFQGKITPVNPRHKTIAGLTSYTNVARLEGPDLRDRRPRAARWRRPVRHQPRSPEEGHRAGRRERVADFAAQRRKKISQKFPGERLVLPAP